MKIRIATIQEFIEKRALVVLLADSETVNLVVYSHENKLYCMESTCPHSGGPLHLGPVEAVDIEDLDKCQTAELICPWHAYRFDIHTGINHDNPLFFTKVYVVSVEQDHVFVEYPGDSVAIKSLKFFNIEPKPSQYKAQWIDKPKSEYSLVDYAVTILNTADPMLKVKLTLEAHDKWFKGELNLGHFQPVPDRPPRHEGLKVVTQGRTKRIGKGNSPQSRIAMLHALANVEQWAIDLAWDIIARFVGTEFPKKDGSVARINEQLEFYNDFVRVAKEEATHFNLLVERINELGSYFGALPVHDGLWDSATDTMDSLAARLAIVHMVHEARGLDVNPSTIEKFKRNGDLESVARLEIIHSDEITHVAAGQRWFSWIAFEIGQDRYQMFHEIVNRLFVGKLRPPFNERDRLIAGLDPEYYVPLAVTKNE